MDKIIFRNVLPSVFVNRGDLHSEIWQTDVTLERDHLYLVEAPSVVMWWVIAMTTQDKCFLMMLTSTT